MTRLAHRYAMATAVVIGWTLAATASQNPKPASANPAPLAESIVSTWTGKINLQLPGKPLSAPSRGQVLPAGTVLDTQDGVLVLLLEDESQILLRPHTRLLLRQPGPGDWNYFELMLGRIRAYIKKRTGGAPPFQLGTPSAVIAVRGTRFDVEVNLHNVTEVDVFDGLVEVSAAGIPGSSVLVRPGYSTRVGMGTPPETPVPTDEIRPDVMAPDLLVGAEFAREKHIESLGAAEDEMTERPDSEVNELEDDIQETIKDSDETGQGKPQPPQ
ncbi:MAG TPA: FecR family protein [Terriglobia bacterium]|nr:FecR family protein [Terriglobia bacterium]